MLLEPVTILTKDLKQAATTLSAAEARYLVDAYYQMQDARIRDDHRIRQQKKSGEPHAVLAWFRDQDASLENQIKIALGKYANGHPVGEWAQSIIGIGPVIAAGLIANIDMTRAPTVGSIWKFAGLDGFAPRLQKGVRRSWSSDFRTLCAYKIGESFVKVQNHPNDLYGKIYAARKQLETGRNEAGAFAEQAAEKLKHFAIRKETDAYKWYAQGKLPPAHIHARARRYAVKLFLSHLHEVWHWHLFGHDAPRPYAFAHLGHAHVISAPHFDKKTFALASPLLPLPVKPLTPDEL